MSKLTFDDLPDRVLIQLNQICNDFERRWRAGEPVAKHALLESIAPAYRALLLRELTELERELEGEAGRSDPVTPSGAPTSAPAGAPTSAPAGVPARAPTGALQPASDLPSLPTQIAQYTLLGPIGAGGMGAVYKAVHQRMQRVVAIKLLRPEHTQEPQFRERFRREIQAAARLSHPKIVTAYDAGEYLGVPYLVSEFIDARNLAEIVRDQGPLAVAEAIDVLLQAAEGLQYLHGQGVVHRDLTPANLLLDGAGNLKILDVGLARLRDDCLRAAAGDEKAVGEKAVGEKADGPELSAPGIVMGTAACMAPEQAQDPRLADERSDIYSLGCTLYFLLTGRHCFTGSSPLQCVLAHLQDPVPRLESPRGVVPVALDAAFRRMLAKQPAARYSTAGELLRDVQRLRTPPQALAVATRSAAGGRTASAQRPAPAAPRSRSSAAGWLLLAILLGAALPVAAAAWWLVGRTPSREEAVAGPQAAPPPPPTADPPPRASAPLVASDARALQHAWAEYLDVPLHLHDERTGIEFVLIPPGEFTMGTTEAQLRALIARFPGEFDGQYQNELLQSETPARRITISKPFYLSRTEVTVAQFRRFVQATGYVTEPERSDLGNGVKDGDWVRQQGDYFDWQNVGEANAWLSDQHPVGNVTWADAAAYCQWCGSPETPCRLPTEAEWEYACRAGTESSWSWGDHLASLHEHAVIALNRQAAPAPLTDRVGQRRPNPFGLFDMHGNLSEYCRDWYTIDAYGDGSPATDPVGPARPGTNGLQRGEYRVHRGGSASGRLVDSRSAARQMNATDNPSGCGIRVLREVSQAR